MWSWSLSLTGSLTSGPSKASAHAFDVYKKFLGSMRSWSCLWREAWHQYGSFLLGLGGSYVSYLFLIFASFVLFFLFVMFRPFGWGSKFLDLAIVLWPTSLSLPSSVHFLWLCIMPYPLVFLFSHVFMMSHITALDPCLPLGLCYSSIGVL